MESSLLLPSPRPLRPFLPLPFATARRRHASFRAKPPAPPPLPPLARFARRLGVAVPRAARQAFDDRPPGVARGGARRRDYREAQGEPAVPPAAAAARAVAPYVVPAGTVLVLSFGMVLLFPPVHRHWMPCSD